MMIFGVPGHSQWINNIKFFCQYHVLENHLFFKTSEMELDYHLNVNAQAASKFVKCRKKLENF